MVNLRTVNSYSTRNVRLSSWWWDNVPVTTTLGLSICSMTTVKLCCLSCSQEWLSSYTQCDRVGMLAPTSHLTQVEIEEVDPGRWNNLSSQILDAGRWSNLSSQILLHLAVPNAAMVTADQTQPLSLKSAISNHSCTQSPSPLEAYYSRNVPIKGIQ